MNERKIVRKSLVHLLFGHFTETIHILKTREKNSTELWLAVFIIKTSDLVGKTRYNTISWTCARLSVPAVVCDWETIAKCGIRASNV